MAAATEWLNALEAGAEVVSVRRREPLRRALNVPREYFSRRGLAAFQRLGAERARGAAALAARAVVSPGRRVGRAARRAAAEGRFRRRRSLNGSEQVICATGFLHGFAARSAACAASSASTSSRRSRAGSSSRRTDRSRRSATRPARSRSPASPAQWAFPAADTLAGAQYVAQRFPEEDQACRTR